MASGAHAYVCGSPTLGPQVMYRRTTPRGRENLPSESGGPHNRELAYYYRSQDQDTAYGVLGQTEKWTRLCSSGEIVCVSLRIIAFGLYYGVSTGSFCHVSRVYYSIILEIFHSTYNSVFWSK